MPCFGDGLKLRCRFFSPFPADALMTIHVLETAGELARTFLAHHLIAFNVGKSARRRAIGRIGQAVRLWGENSCLCGLTLEKRRLRLMIQRHPKVLWAM
jgi:hypothetical protein